MASVCFPDVWAWISNLPPIPQWKTDTMSLCLYSSSASTQPSLNLSIINSLRRQIPNVSLSIFADLNIFLPLWTSNPFHLKTRNLQSFNEDAIVNFLFDIINGVLKYGPDKKSSFKLPAVEISKNLKDVFNLAFLTLSLLVCIYEAPQDLRQVCVGSLMLQLISLESRGALKLLVRILASNLEEQWMRSVNLAVTNWLVEHQNLTDSSFKTPSALFSYASSASGLWKVQLYCPIIDMAMDEPNNTTQDNRLFFSLNYQQLEGVIQFAYKIIVRENWTDVMVNVDNIRCDVIPLVSKTLMARQGHGSEEKHFPSHISLQLTPTLGTDVQSVSVSKSSHNPAHEVGLEKAFELETPSSYLGLKVSASETVTMSMKPWKFEQSVHGTSGLMNWFLHGANGKEVVSSKPSKLTLFQPRAWFKNRYSSAFRPFTKQGGVIFTGDEYGENIWWKVSAGAAGKTMKWEIKGKIWLTYWPNKHHNCHTETRRLKFREFVHLPINEKE